MSQTLVNYKKCIESQLNRLRNDKISERNKEIIRAFHNETIAEGLGFARQNKYIEALRIIAKRFNKDFDRCTVTDIKNYIAELNSSDYSIWTKYTMKVILKRFYKWLKGNNKSYPEEVSWIKAVVKRSEQSLPNEAELLTTEDVKKLIEVTEHPRDKAFIAMLYESGCRIGEIGTVKIKDIQADKYGHVLTVTGKTGSRRIRLIFSTPYLLFWLQCHPDAENKDSPLWINIDGRKLVQPLHSCFAKILRMAFDKAGIKKPSNPHHFRHSRATELANILTEFQMNQYFGWIQGSNMPATYVHLSGKEIDDTILAVNGLKQKENKESALKPKICQRCNTINTNNSERCSNCFALLDKQQFIIEEQNNELIKEKRKFSDSIMNKLFEDPEFRELMVKKVKEININT